MNHARQQELTSAAKLRYISCIAHDLKAPLQSFCFTLDLLQQSHLNAEQHEFAQQASVAVDLMKLTISQTMDITKALSGGKLQPRRTTVLLSSIIQRITVIINGYGRQVPLSFHVSPDVCDAVITDEEWLWQMLLNLLTNACKYTDRGSIEVVVRHDAKINLLDTSGRCTSDAATGALLFEVIDTGVGVSADKLDRLFDAFSQMQEGQVTGTGLGLFGVRTRVEGLHGTWGARHNTASSTGTGTVVWFAIPYMPDHLHRELHRQDSLEAILRTSFHATPMLSTAAACESITALAPVASAGTTPQPARSPTVSRALADRGLTAIVVDDALTVRKLMEKLLLRMGFARVDCYENGATGLGAMLEREVDIVFSDVQMPIMTGPEMVSRFRRWEMDTCRRRQFIVAVTANGSPLGETSNPSGRHADFDAFCAKPISATDLERVVQKCLDPH